MKDSFRPDALRAQPRGLGRRGFLRGAAAMAAGGLGGLVLRPFPWMAGTGALLWPRAARAATVLDPNNPTANFYMDGLQTFTAGNGVLTLLDQNKGDFLVFYAADSDALQTTALDVIATFRVITASPNNADADNRIAINDGISRSVIAQCIVMNGVNGIGLYSSGSPSDPASYPVFVPVDWQTVPVTIRLRRTASGDGEILEINGVPPSPRALLPADQTPSMTRSGPSVEFGCSSVEGECTVEYYAFHSEKVEPPVDGTLNFTRLRIRDTDSPDRLAFRADFQLGAASNGLDPTAEPVTIRLATPGGVFYQRMLAGFAVHGRAPRRRWVLTDAERARTGIEQLVIDEAPHAAGSIALRDFRTGLGDGYFGTVEAEIAIGAGAAADRLTGVARLEERRPGSGNWRLVSEP